VSGSSELQDPVAIGGDGVLPCPGYDDAMTSQRSLRATVTRRGRAPAIGFAVWLVLGACSPGTGSTAPRGSSSPAAPTESSGPNPGGPSAAANVGQTDTDWGRIWDALPKDFPVYPGAVPSDETQTGPVSGIFALNGVEAKVVSMWMESALEGASFATEGLNGPLEDGSYVLDSRGADGCLIQVSAAPLGSVTTVTVRYGAACPSP
jgi:hypothetical protein